MRKFGGPRGLPFAFPETTVHDKVFELGSRRSNTAMGADLKE
jgi:hypothetical protein